MKRDSILIHVNDCIGITHDACRLCYKSDGRDTKEGKLEYIESKIKIGHESIIEHTNVIMMLVLENDNSIYKDLTEVMSASKYLNYTIKDNDEATYVLIGGNIRAYKNIYRNLKNGKNAVLNLITQRLYSTPIEFYHDFIEAGIMNPRLFMDSEFFEGVEYKPNVELRNKYYDIINIDSIEKTMESINFITNDPGLFEYDDILDAHTVTVYFKRLSRVISQQVTRHRNPISQKSQRYVEEGDAEFIHPNEFKDNIDSDVVVNASNLDSVKIMTLKEASQQGLDLYKDMINNGFLKEDARYYLPQNVNTELYMTFTFRSLLHFIYLRKEKNAQAEIRNLADLLYNDILLDHSKILGPDLSIYLLPKYTLSENEYMVENAFLE